MAVGHAHVFPGFLTPVLTQLFFPSHRLLFSHVSVEVRGENKPERKVASTGDRTHNHQVMSPTRSPLIHPGGAVYTYKLELSNKLHNFPTSNAPNRNMTDSIGMCKILVTDHRDTTQAVNTVLHSNT